MRDWRTRGNPLPRGIILCEAGETLRAVYFPASCILSGILFAMPDLQDGTAVETAMAGRGGASAFLTLSQRARCRPASRYRLWAVP